jgi:hypothetical protein
MLCYFLSIGSAMNIQALRRNRSPFGYSSNVRMSLHLVDKSIPVLQSSQKSIKVNDPTEVSHGDAILEISVDGRSQRHPITVVESQPDSQWISIVDR